MKKCIICQKEVFRESAIYPTSVYDKKSYSLIGCTNCGTLFTDPMPSQEELNKIYKENYFYGSHLLTFGEKKYRARKIAQYVGRFGKMETALDFGSMYGFLTEALNEIGIRCTGIEINPEAVEYARKNNIPVVNASLDGYLSELGASHDLVVLSHVMEHLFDPKEKLLAIKERLNDNGKLLIIVPNIEAKAVKLFGKFWGYWEVPVHITHFNKKALRYLIESSGFEILDMRTVGGSPVLFLSTLAKMLGKNGTSVKITPSKRWLISAFSSIMKYWYGFGDDELVVMAQKKKS